MTAAPLSGIRVLDFTHVFAGPFCTRCLADLTAWSSQHSITEVEQRLHASGVPAERMRRADAIIGAPDAGHGYSRQETAYGSPTVVARLPYTFSTSAAIEPEPVPELGAHTRAALQRWLSFDGIRDKRSRSRGRAELIANRRQRERLGRLV